jgi:hypothetical protein
MSMDIGQEPTGEQIPEGEIESQEETANQEPSEPTNPFWGDVQKKLAPNVWQTIKPDLDKADAEARRRIEELNGKYTPWKALADQGYKPEQATSAFDVVKRLNDPEYQVELYESLGNFLRTNGRLPNEQELQQQVAEDAEEGEQEDPRYAALQAQQEQILNFLQSQAQHEQQQIAAQEADSWIEGELNRLGSDQKRGYSPEDLQEIIRIAAFQTTQTGRDPENLDAAAAQFDALRNRIRTAPRAAANAPRIPSGPGGGTPSGDTPTGEMTAQQRRDLVVQRLAAHKQ